MAVKERFGWRALIVLVVVAGLLSSGCSEPKVLWSDEQISTRYKDVTLDGEELIVAVLEEALIEFDGGLHGPSEEIIGAFPKSLADDPRSIGLCDDLAQLDVELDTDLENVDLTNFDFDIFTHHFFVGFSFRRAVPATLVSLHMLEIPGFPVADDVELSESFPKNFSEYDSLVVQSEGELDGWTVDEVRHLIFSSFAESVVLCVGDTRLADSDEP